MKLNEILDIKYPIIQGAMANIATGKFAAAVSNAGGLGIIASGGMDSARLEQEIKECKSLTNKPFGVNIMLMNPDSDNIVKVIVEEKIAVVTTGAGNPAKYMPALKEAGCKVFPVVASVALARKMEKEGAYGIIAEGGESGGHVGDMTTMTLVPQVVKAVNIPVIAAGGIANGNQMLAAIALGAVGVQVGTCLLVSEECPIHENYKLAMLKARDNQTVVTGRSVGTPVRILKNRLSRQYVKMEAEGVDKMELEKFTLGALRRAVFEGDMDMGSVMAGQVCGQLQRIEPIADILENMYSDTKTRLDSLKTECL